MNQARPWNAAPRSVSGALKVAPEKSTMRKRGAFELERLVDDEAAQILDLSPPQRMRKLGEDGAHVLPAAPAGGPAKDCANGPIATMSTSTSCGPVASNARSSALAKSSMSATR